jgi:hypothetical protein
MFRSNKKQTLKGRYVYAWFNEKSILPFYIGKGIASRGWQRHACTGGRAAFCNQLRNDSKVFHVHVVRDNLTNEGAMLLESSLINLFTFLGGCEGNLVTSLKRQEKPPLELEQLREHWGAIENQLNCEITESVQDDLLGKILNVLDETEGNGALVLTPGQIANLVGASRDRVVNCMKANGLNP